MEINREDKIDLNFERLNVHKHRIICCIAAFVFLIWSVFDYINNVSLAPFFFLLRFVYATSVLILVLPLNYKFFNKYHLKLTPIIMITLLTTNLLFINLSHLNLVHITFQVLLMLSIPPLLYTGRKITFLILTLPLLINLVLGLYLFQELGFDHFTVFIGFLLFSVIIYLAQRVFYVYLNKNLINQRDLMRHIAQSKNLMESNKQLIRILCHDLSNAHTVIELSSELIQREVDSDTFPTEKSKQKISKLNNRTKRALKNQQEIIKHVKLKEAIESGKQEIQLNPVNLNIIFDKAKFLFEQKLKEKNITLNISNRVNKNPYVYAELISLSNHVFNNILSNAIKFSNPNSSIDISTWEEENFIYLLIEDYGIGMDENLSKNIFCSTTKTTRPGVLGEKGTGFGMPLVKSYIDKYKAQIFIESKTGKGTRITIKFNRP